MKKKWKKSLKNEVELLTLLREKYIFLFTVATLSCDTRTEQKVLWQIREGNNWLNNFLVFLVSRKTQPANLGSRGSIDKSIQQIFSWREQFMKIITLRGIEIIMESLILAQNERWRRVLSMQVER